LDPLYALPEGLLDIIAGKAKGSVTERTGVAPRFLSKEEVVFERDLARTVSGGFFFHRQPFHCLLLARPADPQVAKADHEIRALLAETLEGEEIHPRRVQTIMDEGARHQEMAALRAAAYAGWLATDPLFRHERDALRQEWGRYVEEERRFPVLRESFLGYPVGRPERGGAARGHFMLFYRRWNLTTFQTWDLPVPMRPALHGGTAEHTVGLSEAGVNLFLPWYVLRDGRFRLAELARHLHNLRNPEHLTDWPEPGTAGGHGLGITRLHHLLILYRYQTLALERRYGNRPGWDVVRQDVAFSRFMNLSEESVKRVRFQLRRRLGR
jgi:hypothetical protein